MKKYTQADFNECLAEMLREAKAEGKLRAVIRRGDLLKRAAPESRPAMTTFAMFRLMLHQGDKAKLVGDLPKSEIVDIKVEFDTSDLP